MLLARVYISGSFSAWCPLRPEVLLSKAALWLVGPQCVQVCGVIGAGIALPLAELQDFVLPLQTRPSKPNSSGFPIHFMAHFSSLYFISLWFLQTYFSDTKAIFKMCVT